MIEKYFAEQIAIKMKVDLIIELDNKTKIFLSESIRNAILEVSNYPYVEHI